eukprot:TRINITY_DN1202_c0_g1_i2.p1 TRINITY_DN1202_c0_g1~~TRINITY_DN1202_c0_g1_i2.p1  ORF type:complete len:362 (+),score=67.54 TRINITY_DN1202_c0_g1_i2:40-1125(+)
MKAILSFLVVSTVYIVLVLAKEQPSLKTDGPPYPPPEFTCQRLPEPPPATDVRHLRPGNINVVMALGDSISAGFAMKTGWIPDPDILEYRNAVFDIGGGAGEMTVPNFLMHYNPKLQGAATHPTLPLTKGSQLDAAVSEAKVEHLMDQVDYLIQELPKYPQIDMKNDWKLLTILIGANNVCPSCNWNRSDVQPQFFEDRVQEVLTKVYQNIPRVFVNLMTIFNVSQVWTVAHGDAYCHLVEHKVSECGCLTDSPTDREAMDIHSVLFNQRLEKVAAEWEAKNLDNFTVVIQPGLRDLDFAAYNHALDYLSNLDCFHPSIWSDQMFAVALWNNMLTPPAQKQSIITPDSMRILCPDTNTYIQ